MTRGVTAQYEARALYTSEREKLAEAIATELRRRIEATLKIAELQNAWVVIVGSAKDGLPIILGGL